MDGTCNMLHGNRKYVILVGKSEMSTLEMLIILKLMFKNWMLGRALTSLIRAR
jgi:hypothetical protein